MANLDERNACLWALSQVSGIKLSFLDSFSWNPADLSQPGFLVNKGLAPKYAELAAEAVSGFDMDKAYDALNKAGASLLGANDSDYPPELRNIYDPPLVLFVRGTIPQGKMMVGIVGSRKATPYGRQAAEALVPPLVAAGAVVVSGLARGIDTLAHVVTLRNGGLTIAVLGSGIDHIYPRENHKLADAIVDEGGAVISEYAPGTEIRKHHFPARNRIISGLSRGVVVVEGDRSSGSLITADHAMEQGREVFAVPGSIFSEASRGPNWLISQGATPVTEPAAILHALGLEISESKKSSEEPLPDHLNRLLSLMGQEPQDVDYLVSKSGFPVSELLAHLAELELSRLVERLPGGLYLSVRPAGR